MNNDGYIYVSKVEGIVAENKQLAIIDLWREVSECIQKINGIGKKLGDGMDHAVHFRPVMGEDLPRQNQTADNRCDVLQNRAQGVFCLYVHRPVTL